MRFFILNYLKGFCIFSVISSLCLSECTSEAWRCRSAGFLAKHFKIYALNFLSYYYCFFFSLALGCSGSLSQWAGFSSCGARPPEHVDPVVEAHTQAYCPMMWGLHSWTSSGTWTPTWEGGFLTTGPLGEEPLLGNFDFIFLCFTINLSTFVVSFTEKNC